MANKEVMTAREWIRKESTSTDPFISLDDMKEYAEYYHSAKSQTAQDVMRAIEREYPIGRYGDTSDMLPPQNRSDTNKNLRTAMLKGYQLNRQGIDWDGLEKEWDGTNWRHTIVGKTVTDFFRTRIQSLVVGDAVEYDEIKELMELHVAFKVFLLRKDFLAVNAMLNSFSDADDINVLKMVLVITKTFKDETLIKHERERILFAYNRKYDSLPPSPTK